MSSKFLCSGYEWLPMAGGEKSINECFREEFKKADSVEISVGYCGYNSLKELEKLVDEGNIKYICLTLGMYVNNGGLSPLSYKLIIDLNEKWMIWGIGEIRLVHNDKYHGKIYCFSKDNQLFSAITGSANFNFLTPPSPKWPKQNEAGQLVTDPDDLRNYQTHIEWLKSADNSINVAEWEENISKIYDEDTSIEEEQDISKIKYIKSLR